MVSWRHLSKERKMDWLSAMLLKWLIPNVISKKPKDNFLLTYECFDQFHCVWFISKWYALGRYPLRSFLHTRYDMSKDKEWVVIDEKIYRLQGAKPKATGKQGRPAIGPNSTGGKQQASPSSGAEQLFQENEPRMSKAKHTRRRPKELISVDNVSLVTAQQVDKIPCSRANSAPLPVLLPGRTSPSRISPSRLSPSPRTPFSAPAQMLSSFQWPSIPEHQGGPDYSSNFVNVSDPEQTKSRINTGKQNGDIREVFSKTENTGPKKLHESESNFNKVFKLPPIPSPQTQHAVSGSPQKVAAAQEKIHIDSFWTEENWTESIHDLKNSIGPRTFSPDSLVAQLIANSEKLTLNDSVESPALQQRKKLARASQKKFFWTEPLKLINNSLSTNNWSLLFNRFFRFSLFRLSFSFD